MADRISRSASDSRSHHSSALAGDGEAGASVGAFTGEYSSVAGLMPGAAEHSITTTPLSTEIIAATLEAVSGRAALRDVAMVPLRREASRVIEASLGQPATEAMPGRTGATQVTVEGLRGITEASRAITGGTRE